MIRKGLISQRKLAKLLGITTRWVRDLEARGVLKKAFGKYGKDECVTAYISFLRGSKDKSLAEAQRIHLETKTKKLLLEAQKLEGSLVDRSELQKQIDHLVHQCEDSFRNLPQRLANVLVKIEDRHYEEKLIGLIIKYGVESCWRDLAGIPKKETPVIHPGETILLALGLIEPDAKGEVIVLTFSFPFTRRVRADEVIQHWREINERSKNRNPAGDPEGMVTGSRDPEAT